MHCILGRVAPYHSGSLTHGVFAFKTHGRGSCDRRSSQYCLGRQSRTTRRVLILSPVGGAGGRNPLPIDSLATVLAGEWKTPKAGDKFTDAAGRECKWTASPFTDGKIGLSPGSHGYLAVTLPREQVLILQASGHSMVFVNGEPRVGTSTATGMCACRFFFTKG